MMLPLSSIAKETHEYSSGTTLQLNLQLHHHCCDDVSTPRRALEMLPYFNIAKETHGTAPLPQRFRLIPLK